MNENRNFFEFDSEDYDGFQDSDDFRSLKSSINYEKEAGLSKVA